jgi:predicted  nucleic acid-binding Zn-ribbon protein
MKKTSTNSRNNHLEEAMALLINNQAAFFKQMSESEKETAAVRREMLELKRESDQLRRESDQLRRESDERFRRIEAILLEHTQLLQALPETIREKIGFKGRQ